MKCKIFNRLKKSLRAVKNVKMSRNKYLKTICLIAYKKGIIKAPRHKLLQYLLMNNYSRILNFNLSIIPLFLIKKILILNQMAKILYLRIKIFSKLNLRILTMTCIITRTCMLRNSTNMTILKFKWIIWNSKT